MLNHETIIIGVPVFNEARFLSATLESIAAQSRTDFKVLIADNCSTDGTGAICEDFIKKDRRFHYHRHRENIGSIDNFRYVFENTSSKYIMWLSGHDMISHNYLEFQLKQLEEDTGTALAYSRVQWVDESGAPMRETNGGNFVRNDISGLKRYLKTMRGPWGECTAVNGIFRRQALANLKFYKCMCTDHILLVLAQYRGKFIRTEKPLYLRRDFSTRDSDYMERITGTNSFRPSLWKLLWAHLQTYFALEMRLTRKLMHFPLFLLYLEIGYGPLRNHVFRFLRRRK